MYTGAARPNRSYGKRTQFTLRTWLIMIVGAGFGPRQFMPFRGRQTPAATLPSSHIGEKPRFSLSKK
jgi:hypothetical protein